MSKHTIDGLTIEAKPTGIHLSTNDAHEIVIPHNSVRIVIAAIETAAC